MQLSPVPSCGGIELLQADTFDLHCFQTLTGTKFLAVTEPQTPDVSFLLQNQYELHLSCCHTARCLPLCMPFSYTPVDTALKPSLCCRIFDLYADYVLKNPFYEVEMPIRCELFDHHLYYLIIGLHRRWGHGV